MSTACETLLIPLVFKTASPSGQHGCKAAEERIRGNIFCTRVNVAGSRYKNTLSGKGKVLT